MDEKKAFEIRRKVLESGVDFEEYISKQQAEIDDQEDTISEAEDLIKQHWTDLQTAQAEIDALVEMLEEMLYSNSTKYREKAEALIVKLKGNDMDNTTNDKACEWLIQHPQVDDHEVDWARDVIVEQQAEIDALASAAIDFIDQMRVQGCEGYTLPAEYDTLVDVVDKYRGK